MYVKLMMPRSRFQVHHSFFSRFLTLEYQGTLLKVQSKQDVFIPRGWGIGGKGEWVKYINENISLKFKILKFFHEKNILKFHWELINSQMVGREDYESHSSISICVQVVRFVYFALLFLTFILWTASCILFNLARVNKVQPVVWRSEPQTDDMSNMQMLILKSAGIMHRKVIFKRILQLLY